MLCLSLPIFWITVASLWLPWFVPPVVADESDLLVIPTTNTGAMQAVFQKGNVLWFGADKGLFYANLDGSGVTQSKVTDQPVTQICHDTLGNLWLGGYGGLFRLAPKSLAVVGTGFTGKIFAMQVFEGDLWIGTDKGLYRRPIGVNSPPVPVKTDISVSSLCIGDGVLWVGTNYGLATWDLNTNKLQPTLWTQMVQRVYQKGNLVWVGDTADSTLPPGIAEPSGQSTSNKNAKTYRYKLLSDPRLTLKLEANAITGRVSQFLEVNGTLWIASDLGLQRWKSDQPIPGSAIILANSGVNGLSLNGETLWIASSSGLYKLKGLNGSEWKASVQVISGPSSLINFLDKPPTIAWEVEHRDWRTTQELIVSRIFLYDMKAQNQPLPTHPVPVGQLQIQLELSSSPEGNILPPGDYRLVVEVEDVHGKKVPSPPYPFSVRDRDWLKKRVLLVVLVSVFASAILFQLLPMPLRRILQAYIFQCRWRLAPSRCDFVFDVLPAREGFRIAELTNSTDVPTDYVNPATTWPPDSPNLDKYRPRMRGKRIRVEVDPSAFRYPWSQLIGDSWGMGMEAAVAGQLIQNSGAVLPPPPRRRLWFAGLGCAKASNDLPYLYDLEPELCAVTKVFRRSHAKIVIPEKNRARYLATPADLSRSLQVADIVHLGAHAQPEQIHLADGSSFTSTDVEAIPSIRCRLLILSACETADFQNTAGNYAEKLVRRGVNLLASVGPLSPKFTKAFFPFVYEYLLHNGSPSETDLCAAIQLAAALWYVVGTKSPLPAPDGERPRWYDQLEWIDRLVLFGDPTLRFHFG